MKTIFNYYNRTWNLLLLLMVAIGFNSCRPSGPDFIDQYDVIYTKKMDGFNFASTTTYFLADSVTISSGTANDHRFDDDILNAIDRNLQAYGWRKLSISGTAKADVVILVSAAKNSTTVCTPWCWDCWGWWPGWGYYPGIGPNWGWWYPGGLACSSLRTGSMIINMAHPGSAAGTQLPLIWLASVNGLLDGSDAGKVARINSTIDQAFQQSSYLKK